MTVKWKRTALALLSAGVIITFAGSTQHVMAQYTSQTSYDGTSFSSEGNIPLAKPRWTADIGQALNELGVQPSVAAGSGSLYYINKGALTARSITTGKTLWSFGNKLDASSLKLAGAALYTYTSDGSVYRVSASTGKGTRIYQVKDKLQQGQSAISNLTIDGTSLYITSTLGLISINSTTGKQNWLNTSVTYYQRSQRIGNTLLVEAVESGAVTVNTTYAVDAQTGKTLWRLQGSHEGPLKVEGNKLYFQDTWFKNDSSKFVVDIDVVDLTTGKIMTSKSFIPVLEGVDPLIQYPGKVIMVQNDVLADIPNRGLFRVNFNTDSSIVPPAVIQDSGTWIAGPYDGKLFYKNENNLGLHARKIADQTMVDYQGLDNPVSRMDIIDSGLYAGQTDGDIFAFNVTTGKAMFRYKTPARNYGPFQVEGNTLLVQADGKLYAFDLPAELRKSVNKDAGAGLFSKAVGNLTIDGVERKFEPSMMTTANRMFVPLRFLTEALGAKTVFNSQTKETTVTYGDRTFSISEGAPYALVAGKQTPLTYAPAIINNSLYVPIRDFGTLLGVEITWNTSTRTVAVKTK